VVWGGIWGFLFLLPLKKISYVSLGIIYSLPQTLIALLVMAPRMGRGLLAWQQGWTTPILILFFGIIWGATTGLWLKWSRES
jgi:hypothetical protein